MVVGWEGEGEGELQGAQCHHLRTSLAHTPSADPQAHLNRRRTSKHEDWPVKRGPADETENHVA